MFVVNNIVLSGIFPKLRDLLKKASEPLTKDQLFLIGLYDRLKVRILFF